MFINHFSPSILTSRLFGLSFRGGLGGGASCPRAAALGPRMDSILMGTGGRSAARFIHGGGGGAPARRALDCPCSWSRAAGSGAACGRGWAWSPERKATPAGSCVW